MKRATMAMLSLSMFAACAPLPPVSGLARVSRPGEHVVFALCDSSGSYELGGMTSNSAPGLDDALARVRADGAAYVYLSGSRATRRATRARPGEREVLLLGAIRTVPSRPEGCAL